MNENKNWYAIYIRRGKEKKLTETLNKKKIENYCPLNRVYNQSGTHKEWTYEPLFSSYTFVRITEGEIALIKQMNGVINLLFWMGKPAMIDNFEIELIKKFITEYADIRIERIGMNMDYSLVMPITLDGNERKDYLFDVKNKTVTAFLPSLGYSLVAAVEKAEMEVPAPPIFPKWSSGKQKIAGILSLGS